jgi:hypothetical protein
MSPEELNQLRSDGALLCSIIGRRVKLRKAGHQWKGCCPFHNENTASFIVYSDATAHYHCFGCGAHGSVFDFVMATERVDFAEAARRVAAEAGMAESNTKKSGNGEQEGDIWEPMVPPPTGAPKPDDAQLHCDMLHEYCGADDQILYYIRRIEAKDGKPKQFYPLTYGVLNGRTGWHSKAPSEPRLLYGLNRLSHAPLEATILLCEGEKAADAAQRMFPDMVAMTWPGGAQADGKVDLSVIRDRFVILWPDADPGGRDAMSRIAQRLPHVQIIDTTDLPDGFDAADLEHDDVDDAGEWFRARLQQPDVSLPGDEGAADDGDNSDRLGGGARNKESLDDTSIDVLAEIDMLGSDLTLKKLVQIFNRKYAVANEGGKAVVIWAVHDPLLKRDRHERASFLDFERFFQNHTLKVGGGIKSFAELWLDDPKRRQYLGGVVFDPAGRAKADTLNLWRGWAVTPKPGDWSLMRDHIKNIICGGRIEIYNYVIRWLAHMVQKPHLAAEVAIVLRGLKGTGKGMLGKWLLRLCGQHGLHIVNASHLTGRFSGHLRDAIFIFAVPGTAELSEQKIHSLDSLHRWWLAVLDRGFVWRSRYGHKDFLTWGTFVSTELLNQSYRQWCNDNRVSYPEHREALGKFMAKFYRPTRPNGAYPIFEAESVDREHPEPVVKMGRPRGFLVDDLDTARCTFSKVLGFPAGTFAWDHAADEGGTGQFARKP